MNLSFIENNIYFFVLLLIWELVWKGFALWKSAKNGHKYWFIGILLINSAGLLPILYLLIYRKN